VAGSDHETLSCERTGAVLRVALNRPAVRNAFNDTLIAEFTEVLRAAADEDDLRCLVLSGNGPTFCAGADLNWMRAAANYTPEENEADARRMARLFRSLLELPCPTLAQVQGAALGGACGLLACCDIVIAETGVKFGFTEVRLGIIPAVISAFVLRKISRADAQRYFITGEIFDGLRAEKMGLISETAEPGAVAERTDAILEQILSVGPRAAREAKRLVERVQAGSWPDILDETSRLIADIRSTPEAREGIAAFLEKRQPAWREPAP